MIVEFYERIWMWAAVGLLVIFLGTIILTAASDAVHPPSHMETVDPGGLAGDPEFGKPAVTMRPDGRVVVSVVAQLYSFAPDPIEVPANRPLTFRITSADVMHGFEIAGRNSLQQSSMHFPQHNVCIVRVRLVSILLNVFTIPSSTSFFSQSIKTLTL